MSSALYTGYVTHERRAPVTHRFRYAVASFCLDLDELPALAARVWGFGVDRPNLVSFRAADHLDGGAAPLKERLTAFLRTHGIALDGGPVYLLTQCRVFGYIFNPVAFYFCHTRAGALRCIVAEVNNTFGERHLYVLGEGNRLPGHDAAGSHRYAAQKVLHVSPFVSMDAAYEFRFAPLGEQLSIAIRETERGTPFFTAHLSGRRQPLTSATLARFLLRFPLHTLKIIGTIHWEALRLYWKGAPFHSQPAPSAAQRAQDDVWRRVDAKEAA